MKREKGEGEGGEKKNDKNRINKKIYPERIFLLRSWDLALIRFSQPEEKNFETWDRIIFIPTVEETYYTYKILIKPV